MSDSTEDETHISLEEYYEQLVAETAFVIENLLGELENPIPEAAKFANRVVAKIVFSRSTTLH